MKEVDKGVNKVERYLQRATRGLWGHRRGEVREEFQRRTSEERAITVHTGLRGLVKLTRLRRTLREMGEPGEVSVGMTKLYTAPWVAGSGILAAAVCAVSVAFISMGMAQTLRTAQTFPSPNCLESADTEDPFCQDAGAWATVEALREVLGPQGVTLSREGEVISLRFSDGTSAKANASSVTVFNENDKKRPEADQPRSDYFNLWFFLRDLVISSPLPVQIEGWNNLNVQIGDTSFMLSADQKQAESFYYDYLTSVAFNPNQLLAAASQKNPTVNRVEKGEGTKALVLRVEDSKPDAVYGIFTPIPADADTDLESDLSLAADVAQVHANNTSNLYLSANQPLTFIDGFSGQPQLNTAVLVRLTGTSKSGIGFGYEVVPPEQISVVN